MLIIVQGQSNDIFCTVTGNSSANSEFYRFVFRSDQQKKDIEVTLENISDHTTRYDLFTLVEGADIDLKKTGQYKYTVFDADDVEVETGKALVLSLEEAKKYVHTSPSFENFIHS